MCYHSLGLLRNLLVRVYFFGCACKLRLPVRFKIVDNLPCLLRRLQLVRIDTHLSAFFGLRFLILSLSPGLRDTLRLLFLFLLLFNIFSDLLILLLFVGLCCLGLFLTVIGRFLSIFHSLVHTVCV